LICIIIMDLSALNELEDHEVFKIAPNDTEKRIYSFSLLLIAGLVRSRFFPVCYKVLHSHSPIRVDYGII